ncbi:hypothetical protein ACJ73_03488 [Blastomyces percursus]|uniref:Uncharacterized protein n=1 Tax=Blastomyces percursus TaxID=1658174 RepID=A0A1J9Q9L0_9EURO|nr:hypothetical protein ACJ73_03488 [Blastomyces percursus]
MAGYRCSGSLYVAEEGFEFFMRSNSHPQPLFSLMQFEVFLPLLMDDEDRIDILREYAPTFFPEARADEVIIRYRFKGLLNQQQQEEEEKEGEGEEGKKAKLCEPLAGCETSEKSPNNNRFK